MVEKQASSEIAQSRERFEKWANGRDRKRPLDLSRFPDGIYVSNFALSMWDSWQAAERDTRERVAQELNEICDLVKRQVNHNHKPESCYSSYCPLCRAEHIRGKE